MNTTPSFLKTEQKSITRAALVAAGILLIPFFGNMYVDGWNWGLFDFIFAGALLFCAGFTYELVSKRMSNKAYKFAVALTVITGFCLVWINLAVGIIGDENPANVLYFLIPLVGFIGAILSRLEPRGIARTLIVMAVAQMTVPIIAFIFWKSNFAPGVLRVFTLNAIFAMLWVGSALLFLSSSATGLKVKPTV